MPLSSQQIVIFQAKILTWYEKNKRDLPWREVPFDTSLQQRDPYKLLVSEVMSQQTQVSRVIPKYNAWIERFPTLESLAKAPTREVLLYWSGLGYNRRALNLQKTAKTLTEKSSSSQKRGSDSRWHENDSIVWSRTYEELVKLPGIGKYTANALLCFAFNEQVAVVDTNVRRVILTQFPISNIKFQMSNREKKPRREGLVLTEREIEEVAKQLLPKGKAYEWNQALMDYATAMLKDKKIAIPKQSPFRISNRYYRGQIMKVLVRQHTASIHELWQYFEEHNPIEKGRFDLILRHLEKDGLIRIIGQNIHII